MDKKEYWSRMLSIIANQDDSVEYAKRVKYIELKGNLNNDLKLKTIFKIIYQIKTNQYEPECINLYTNDSEYKTAYCYGLIINSIICMHSLKKVLNAYDSTLDFDGLYKHLVHVLYKISNENNKYLNKEKLWKIVLNSTSLNQLHRIINFNLINKNNISK